MIAQSVSARDGRASSRTCKALVPAKASHAGKGRLAGTLVPRERRQLIELMLADVVAALRASEAVDEIRIVGPDPQMVPDGCVWADDQGLDVNSALLRAAQDAASDGATFIVIVAADVPLANPKDIQSLVDAVRVHDVVLVPDRHSIGTNAMALTAPCSLRPQFGPLSYRIHQWTALARGLSLATLPLSSLAHDIDQPQDLRWLLEASPDRYGFLRPALLRAS